MLITTPDDVHSFDALGQQYTNVPECTGLSAACSSTTPFPRPFIQPPPHHLAAFTGPGPAPSPSPTLSWSCKSSSYLPSGLDCSPTRSDSPLPVTTYAAAGNGWSGTYDMPPDEPNLGSQWPYPTSMLKGKARATDNVLQVNPPPTGDTSK